MQPPRSPVVVLQDTDPLAPTFTHSFFCVFQLLAAHDEDIRTLDSDRGSEMKQEQSTADESSKTEEHPWANAIKFDYLNQRGTEDTLALKVWHNQHIAWLIGEPCRCYFVMGFV